MSTPNFTQCAIDFENSGDLYANYVYTGPVHGILKGANLSLITVQGCRDLCGTGNEYYAWDDIASTISTWVLPILGLLLQAPFESNAFLQTLWAIARWVGSPIASLSYTLWNIKITSKCALMIDMATKYEELPPEESQYAQIRDSFFILSVMNQYAIKRRLPSIESERLLRVALFSEALEVESKEGEFNSLVSRRRELARVLRDGRKKGVVPVFISFMWFLFSLAITIESAFGEIGDNATAHDLALGLLLAYFPVLILCTIVDRNPTAPESVMEDLNRFVAGVRSALLNPEIRETYLRETWNTTKESQEFAWMDDLANENLEGDFFITFAGQGRIRYHYGVAHPILAGIEESFVAQYGRDWLRDHETARKLLVKGPDHLHGLHSFDFRELWQIIFSITIVCGAAVGAFIISYFTPTVGLGCRSGGYVVFNIIALGSFGLEGLVWWLAPDGYQSKRDPFTLVLAFLDRHLSKEPIGRLRRPFQRGIRRALNRWTQMSTRERYDVFMLRVIEVVNTGWLTYISFAQVLGSYQNCDCMASLWASGGGYIDFQDYAFYLGNGVAIYWGAGTGLSVSVMAVAVLFIIKEWCVQSHLSTGEYENAQAGLMRTRRFKKYTYYIRRGPDILFEWAKVLWHSVGRNQMHEHRIRRSLVWNAHTKPGQEIQKAVVERRVKAGPRYTWSGEAYEGRHGSHGSGSGSGSDEQGATMPDLGRAETEMTERMLALTRSGTISVREGVIRSGTIRPGPKRSYLPL